MSMILCVGDACDPSEPTPPPPPKNFGGCSGGAGPGAGGPNPTDNDSNPINAATGNKYQRETDYMGAGPNPLRFERHYNSYAQFDGAVGQRWRHTYERHLDFVDHVTIVAHREDGREFEFNFVDGMWRPDPDVTLRLVEVADEWLLFDESDAQERYVADGKLTALTPRGGVATTLGYDTNGRLATVDDGYGRTLTFTYDSDARIATMTDPGGGVHTFSYAVNGNLIEVGYPGGTNRSYEYAATGHPHALTAITDESGTIDGRWEYDTQGRATAYELAGGARRIEFEYHADGTTTATDAAGGSRVYTFEELHGVFRTKAIAGDPCVTCGAQAQQYTFDANGFVSAAIDRNGVETRYTRDARGLELSRTEAFGTLQARTVTTEWHAAQRVPVKRTQGDLETTYTYDGAGRLLTETAKDLVTNETRTTAYSYTADGLTETVTGPRGDVTAYSYDQSGNLVTVTNAVGHVTQFGSYDGHGNAGTITDPNGVVTTLQYDPRRRLTHRTVAGHTTQFAYDPAGRLTRVTLPTGSRVDYEYDVAGRMTAIADGAGNRIEYVLDALGNRTEERVKGPGGTTERQHFQVFDKLSRVIEAQGGAGQVTTFGYDPVGNRTSIDDAFQNTTTSHFDALNRVFQEVDALGGETHYGYDELDRLTQVVDPRGVTTGYTYNAFGDPLTIESPDAGTSIFEYDAAGNRTQQTDARGIVTKYDYDLLNRLTAIRYPAHPDKDITYTWDTGPFGIGRLARIDDDTGSTVFGYDAHGHLVSRVNTARGTTLPLFQERDAAGNLVSLMHPDGREVVYSRDAQDRVTAITLVEPGGEDVPLATGIAWDPFGGLTSLTYGNGLGHSRSYDLSGRVTEISTTGVQQLTYQWDATDNITTILDGIDASRSRSYGYDALYRLTDATDAFGSQSFQYDAVGNRTRLIEDLEQTDYAYAQESNRLTAAGANAFVYDAAGNTLDDGERQYQYDARNRMVQAGNHVYGYNALGQRAFKPRFGVQGDISGDGQVTEQDLALLQEALRGRAEKTMAMDCNSDGVVDNRDVACIAGKLGAFKNEGQTRGRGASGPPTAESQTAVPVQVGWVLFQYDDAGRLIGEYDEFGNPIRQYVWLDNMPVAMVNADGVFYLHADHLNTPRLATDQDGDVVWRSGMRAFGDQPAEVGEGFEMPLRFPGQYHDAETGLHHNWYREYLPAVGRYSQSDPIGLLGGPNVYLYSYASPINMADPTGLSPNASTSCQCESTVTPSGILGVQGSVHAVSLGFSLSVSLVASFDGQVCIVRTICGRIGPGLYIGGGGLIGGGIGLGGARSFRGGSVGGGADVGFGASAGVQATVGRGNVGRVRGRGGVGYGFSFGADFCYSLTDCTGDCE